MTKDVTVITTLMKTGNTQNRSTPVAKPDEKTAALEFFAGVEPIIREFCGIPYFRETLGINEIRSISHTKLLEFYRQTKPVPDKSTASPLLKRILLNELVNNVHRHETRRKYQQPLRTETGREDADPVTPTESLPADKSCEPETCLLQKELARDLEEALNSLKPQEQEVIRGLYYEGKSNKALAKELNVSPQYVSSLKQRSLARLRNLLEMKYPQRDLLY